MHIGVVLDRVTPLTPGGLRRAVYGDSLFLITYFYGILVKWPSYIKEIQIQTASSAIRLSIKDRTKYKEIKNMSFVAWLVTDFLAAKRFLAQSVVN